MPLPRKIALTGPESTGKTWLADCLAERLGGIRVPEYARAYLADLRRAYDLDDVLCIAHGQAQAEHEAVAQGAEWIFCDTDMLVCKIWVEKRFGVCPPELEELYRQQSYDLHLLCSPDLPWTPDPLREAPELAVREELFAAYRAALETDARLFRTVDGTGEARLRSALAHLAAHFG
jgi:NadR type nicotinamide-nucleotide adenylyltransferase